MFTNLIEFPVEKKGLLFIEGGFRKNQDIS